MSRIRGGMDFWPGQPIRLPQPPLRLPAQPIHLLADGGLDIAPGTLVHAGQVIGPPAGEGQPYIVSPVTGKIRENRQQSTNSVATNPDPSLPCDTVIDPIEQDVPTSFDISTPRGWDLGDWLDAVKRSPPWVGWRGEAGLVADLHFARSQPPDQVICIGLDAFPPFPDRSSLLTTFPDEVALGTRALADITGAKSAMIVTGKHPKLPVSLKASCRSFRVSLVRVHNRYPSADPVLVAWTHGRGRRLLRKNAEGKVDILDKKRDTPADRGLMMVSPWAAIRLARWIHHQHVDLVYPLMIAWPGPGASLEPCFVMPGQPLRSVSDRLADALESDRYRVILGNPMTGREARLAVSSEQERPIMPTDERLITVLAESTPRPQPQPCVSCGWCVDLCPTGLHPVHLRNQCLADQRPASLEHQLKWCIGCGLCTHVCPSSIPLAETLTGDFNRSLVSSETLSD